MRLAVVGSRSFLDWELFTKILDILVQDHGVTEIVSGGAVGADAFARKYAKLNNLKLTEHLPDWDLHGKKAGYIRNVDIWNSSDMGVAFWDGSSKGTAHSFKISEKQKKPLLVFNYNEHRKWWLNND